LSQHSIARTQVQLLCHCDVGIASGGIAFGSFCEPPVLIGMDVVRVELDGLVVVRDGAIEVLLEIVGYAPVVEGQGEIRVEPDGLVVVCNGAVGRALVCRTLRKSVASSRDSARPMSSSGIICSNSGSI
jgi:hypothetical protein